MNVKSMALSSTIFLVGLAVAVLAWAQGPHSFEEPRQRSELSSDGGEFVDDGVSIYGYIGVFQGLSVDDLGEERLSHLSIRYQRSDGSWREDTFFAEDGKLVFQNTQIGDPERGGLFRNTGLQDVHGERVQDAGKRAIGDS